MVYHGLFDRAWATPLRRTTESGLSGCRHSAKARRAESAKRHVWRQALHPGPGQPKGHYSHAVVHNGFVFVSGQLPMDNEGNLILGTIEEQTLLCLKRIDTILKSANSNVARILKVNVFVADINDWSRINAVFAEYFGEHRPARIVVPAGTLNYGCGVEIDCVAGISE